MSAHFDLVIKDGFIIDGTGAPRYRGDMAVRDGGSPISARSSGRRLAGCSTRPA